MKSLFFTLLLLTGVANAYPTVTPLQNPLTPVYQHQYACEGQSFNADDSITGMCRDLRSTACSGRGCQPVQYSTFYAVTWDSAGNPTSATQCGEMRHHLPQANQWTYAPGFDATNCNSFTLGTATTVGIPYGPYVWDVTYYYYVTASADGAFEIVNGQTQSYVVSFQ